MKECLLKWFKQNRVHNVRLGGNMLKEKDEYLAEKLGTRTSKAEMDSKRTLKINTTLLFKNCVVKDNQYSMNFLQNGLNIFLIS